LLALTVAVSTAGVACTHYHPANEGLASAAPSGEAAPLVASDGGSSDAGSIEGTSSTSLATDGNGASLIDISSTHGDRAKMLAMQAASAAAAAASANAAAGVVTPGTVAPAASASAQVAAPSQEDVAAAKTAVSGRDASAMKGLGGAYLCNVDGKDGVPGTAMEWAFPLDASALSSGLTDRLKGASRSGDTFKIGDTVVVEVLPYHGKSTLGCFGLPPSTKSLVLVRSR